MFLPKQLRKIPDVSSAGETAARLAALREELRKIERRGWNGKTGEAIALGLPEIDSLLAGENLFDDKALAQRKKAKALPLNHGNPPESGISPAPGSGGLQRGCLHEFAGEGAEAFAAILSGRLKGPVLWCADMLDASALYPPGLAAFGLDHRRLILVRCRKPREILAAMEDGLRCRALAAVIGEVSSGVDLTASRRLQLAAENSGVTGFLLKSAWRDKVSKSPPPGTKRAIKARMKVSCQARNRVSEGSGAALSGVSERETSAAFSRWSVNSARSNGANGYAADAMTWRLSLLRCRNGGCGVWTVKWDAKAYRFSLAAEVADGQVDPSPEQSSGQRMVG